MTNQAGTETKWLWPPLYDKLAANPAALLAFESVEAKFAGKDFGGHAFLLMKETRAACAVTLTSGTQTAESLISVIEQQAARYAGQDPLGKYGWDQLTANLILYGVELIDKHKAAKLVDIDAVESALRALPQPGSQAHGANTVYLEAAVKAVRALAAHVAPDVPAPDVVITPDLGRTEDPKEILRRALDPHAYTFAGNATIGVGTPSEAETTEQRTAALEKAAHDFPKSNPDVRTVLCRTGNTSFDIGELGDKTLEDFVPLLVSGGKPRITD